MGSNQSPQLSRQDLPWEPPPCPTHPSLRGHCWQITGAMCVLGARQAAHLVALFSWSPFYIWSPPASASASASAALGRPWYPGHMTVCLTSLCGSEPHPDHGSPSPAGVSGTWGQICILSMSPAGPGQVLAEIGGGLWEGGSLFTWRGGPGSPSFLVVGKVPRAKWSPTLRFPSGL